MLVFLSRQGREATLPIFPCNFTHINMSNVQVLTVSSRFKKKKKGVQSYVHIRPSEPAKSHRENTDTSYCKSYANGPPRTIREYPLVRRREN